MSTSVILGSAAEANPDQEPQELPLMHAMRYGIELLADKILVSQMVRSSSVQPLSRAVLAGQARGDGRRGDARVAASCPAASISSLRFRDGADLGDQA